MKKHLLKAFLACLFVGMVAININLTYKQGEKVSNLKSLLKLSTASGESTQNWCTGRQYWCRWQIACDKSTSAPCSATVPC